MNRNSLSLNSRVPTIVCSVTLFSIYKHQDNFHLFYFIKYQFKIATIVCCYYLCYFWHCIAFNRNVVRKIGDFRSTVIANTDCLRFRSSVATIICSYPSADNGLSTIIVNCFFPSFLYFYFIIAIVGCGYSWCIWNIGYFTASRSNILGNAL